jgi:hypothetical protein
MFIVARQSDAGVLCHWTCVLKKLGFHNVVTCTVRINQMVEKWSGIRPNQPCAEGCVELGGAQRNSAEAVPGSAPLDLSTNSAEFRLSLKSAAERGTCNPGQTRITLLRPQR